MLAFFDESGHPHPKDLSTRPVCVTVCLNEKDSHFISGRMHALKRDVTQREDVEFKAQKLLNRATFRRIPEKRELVEAFFDLLRTLPITIFGVIMERPQKPIITETLYLPNQFRYLLQRCDILAKESNSNVTLLFDGDCKQVGGLSLKFNSFLYRAAEGQTMTTITDAPFFVDSRVTAGIQIADMAAGVIRIYNENSLYRGAPRGDSFLSAIRRYYTILEEKTKDLLTAQGEPRPGFYLMPERAHYTVITIKEPAPETIAEHEEHQKPENQA